nr:MAG TPA: hypothetical protein [Caudoviricetes sp.]DAQ57043.1 MAG TPA: hypothetical protein [Caudoviricetes sp.]
MIIDIELPPQFDFQYSYSVPRLLGLFICK